MNQFIFLVVGIILLIGISTQSVFAVKLYDEENQKLSIETREVVIQCEFYYEVLVAAGGNEALVDVKVLDGNNEIPQSIEWYSEEKRRHLNLRHFEVGKDYHLIIEFNGKVYDEIFQVSKSRVESDEDRMICHKNFNRRIFEEHYFVAEGGGTESSVMKSLGGVSKSIGQETYIEYRPYMFNREGSPSPDEAFLKIDELEELLIQINLDGFNNALPDVEERIKSADITIDEKAELLYEIRKYHEEKMWVKQSDVLFRIPQFIKNLKLLYLHDEIDKLKDEKWAIEQSIPDLEKLQEIEGIKSELTGEETTLLSKSYEEERQQIDEIDKEIIRITKQLTILFNSPAYAEPESEPAPEPELFTEPEPEPEPEPVCGAGTVLKDGVCVVEEQQRGGGCLIATATYGSELAPQVQFLREIRDNSLLQTESGRSFMESFNQFYYSFSPGIADLERENPVFKETVKIAITPLISSLSILNYVDINSEAEVLGFGISLILLNVGMYFVLPAIVIHRVRKFV